ESLVEPDPIPNRAAVNAFGRRHPAVYDHLIEFGSADTDVLGGLDAG
ncbi:MAG: hypothetical protein JO007_10300, partial [Alphaproteobacteria bacterium]|nr:hypothetical protein [Alphaproteobacteria bacterium]